MKDKMCFFRPKADPKCVDALPKHCPGMQKEGCLANIGKCHWDWEAGGKKWETSCFAGAGDGTGDQKPIKPHQQKPSSSSTSTTSSTSSTTSTKTTSSTSTTSSTKT